MDKYRKRQELLGLRKDGRTRVRGPRTVHATTEPINHSHLRDFEVVAEGDDVIGRSGGKAKGYPIAVHSGQHSRTRGGTLITGQTMTTMNGVPDAVTPLGGRASIDPVVSKRTQAPAKPVIGHRSRTQMHEDGAGCCVDGKSVNHEAAMSVSDLAHAARHTSGANIIEEGLRHAGPDHPANLKSK